MKAIRFKTVNNSNKFNNHNNNHKLYINNNNNNNKSVRISLRFKIKEHKRLKII